MDGDAILSQEGTTQGDLLPIPMQGFIQDLQFGGGGGGGELKTFGVY